MVVERLKLDRLTLDEARTIAAPILEVIHGLVQHMKVIMKGEKTGSARHDCLFSFLLDGKASINRAYNAQSMS